MHKTTQILITSITLATQALAGAPLITETADSLDRGSCELEAAAARETSSGLPSVRGAMVSLGCGVGLDSQLALAHRSTRQDGSREQALRLAAKTTFVAPQAGRAGWGLAYAVESVKAPGGAWRSETVDVVLLHTHELASGLRVHANLGHGRSRGARRDSTLWSLGVEHGDDLTLAADVFGDDRSRPGVSAGVGFGIAGGFSVNATVAWQFEQPRVRSLSVGARLEF